MICEVLRWTWAREVLQSMQVHFWNHILNRKLWDCTIITTYHISFEAILTEHLDTDPSNPSGYVLKGKVVKDLWLINFYNKNYLYNLKKYVCIPSTSICHFFVRKARSVRSGTSRFVQKLDCGLLKTKMFESPPITTTRA